jgi:hypothetical protein
MYGVITEYNCTHKVEAVYSLDIFETTHHAIRSQISYWALKYGIAIQNSFVGLFNNT